MEFNRMISKQPAKFMFWIAGIAITIAIWAWRLDRRFGNTPYADQSDREQGFRLVGGFIVMNIPYFVFCGIIYWLMYKYKRPTKPQLNYWHIMLLIVSISIQCVYYYHSLDINLGANFSTMNPLNLFAVIVAASSKILFIYNVVMSLWKPNIIELNETEESFEC